MKSAKSVSIIGGADGPTSIFLAGYKEKNIFKRFRMHLKNKKYRRKRKKAEKSIVPGAHTMEETVLYMRQHYGVVEADDSYPHYEERKEDMRYSLVRRARPERFAVVGKIYPPEDYHLFIIDKGEQGKMEIEVDTCFPNISISYSGDGKIMETVLKDIYRYYGVSQEDIDHKTERYRTLVAVLGA